MSCRWRVQTDRDPPAVLLALKSWPEFLTLRRMLRLRAKFTASWIWATLRGRVSCLLDLLDKSRER